MIFHDHVNPLALTNRHEFHFEMSFIYLWLLTLNISCLIFQFEIQNDWFQNIFRGFNRRERFESRTSAMLFEFPIFRKIHIELQRTAYSNPLCWPFFEIHSFFFLPEYTFQTIITLYEFMIFSRSFTLANCRFDSDY